MDTVSKAIRSEVMRSIRSTDNKSTELKFRYRLMRVGIRGWKVRPKMEFSPDFVFHEARIIVFVDGCFWHCCPICRIKTPSSHVEYWRRKLRCNIERDKLATKKFTDEGWLVLRFWEHEIKENPDGCIDVLKTSLLKRMT